MGWALSLTFSILKQQPANVVLCYTWRHKYWTTYPIPNQLIFGRVLSLCFTLLKANTLFTRPRWRLMTTSVKLRLLFFQCLTMRNSYFIQFSSRFYFENIQSWSYLAIHNFISFTASLDYETTWRWNSAIFTWVLYWFLKIAYYFECIYFLNQIFKLLVVAKGIC